MNDDKLYKDKYTYEYITKNELKDRRENFVYDRIEDMYLTKQEYYELIRNLTYSGYHGFVSGSAICPSVYKDKKTGMYFTRQELKALAERRVQTKNQNKKPVQSERKSTKQKKVISEKKKKNDEINKLKIENKELQKTINEMIKYAPGSDEYNKAKTRFESLQNK